MDCNLAAMGASAWTNRPPPLGSVTLIVVDSGGSTWESRTAVPFKQAALTKKRRDDMEGHRDEQMSTMVFFNAVALPTRCLYSLDLQRTGRRSLPWLASLESFCRPGLFVVDTPWRRLRAPRAPLSQAPGLGGRINAQLPMHAKLVNISVFSPCLETREVRVVLPWETAFH
ncbi:hypothetical protein C8R46DRAFT_371 [Mycena filopes]|nr:hypothetical protein C8R46DRAFT_371 [Mycena filopes]